jgi:hypothetical protein
MRHRNSRSEDLCRGVASAVYEPVGSAPSPPHSLSGGMVALILIGPSDRICPSGKSHPFRLTLAGQTFYYELVQKTLDKAEALLSTKSA